MRQALSCCVSVVLILSVLLTPAAQSTKSTRTNNKCEPAGNRICRLAVQITTSKRRGAGTDNAVYFDIGPMSWRLNKSGRNDFEGGNTDEFLIEFSDKSIVTTDDILWLRLQKKGLLGFNGSEMGSAAHGIPNPRNCRDVTFLATGRDSCR